MIPFLFKGIIRDRSRSLFPFLTVVAGVFLTVGFYCYMKGAEFDITRYSANMGTGHVKVMTRAYAKEADQFPSDAALTGVGALIGGLQEKYPEFDWAARILFGGLLDVPDEKGETRSQGPVAGIAADILTPGSKEPGRLALEKGLIRGRLPSKSKEILISEELSRKLGIGPGDTATFIGVSMDGSMTMSNFVLSGTVRFGVQALDRMGAIADVADIREALDMPDAAGEVLGFYKNSLFDREKATATARAFNALYEGREDDFLPTMVTLTEQNSLAAYFAMFEAAQAAIIAIFLLPMSLVLWNAGLLGSLRRYGEIGVRLAIGEDKRHVYKSMLAESLIIGVLGSVVGTILGLGVAYWLQTKGIDISGVLRNATILIPTVLHAKVTPFSYVIGFIPGLLATFLGTAIAGRGVYKRQTAQLFKELET
jgi:putative ABC transport system permease protein